MGYNNGETTKCKKCGLYYPVTTHEGRPDHRPCPLCLEAENAKLKKQLMAEQEERFRFQSRVEELEAKLPKTADGKVVCPGDLVYRWEDTAEANPYGITKWKVVSIQVPLLCCPGDCYSTEEEALEKKGGE